MSPCPSEGKKKGKDQPSKPVMTKKKKGVTHRKKLPHATSAMGKKKKGDPALFSRAKWGKGKKVCSGHEKEGGETSSRRRKKT